MKIKLNIAIVGTGAVGGYYGIMLSQLGHNVHFLLRSEYAYVKEYGLTLQSTIHGELHLPKVNAYQDPENMPKIDVVIVALKTMHNRDILPKVLPKICDQNTIVIMIQNGLGMEEELSKWLPNLQIAGATALILAHKKKNGLIVHEGYGAINFGSFNLKNNYILDSLVSELNRIEIPAQIGDLKTLRWQKLVWNMTFNGLSVVVDGNTDYILTHYLTRAKTIMNEVIVAAKANGVFIPDSYIDELIPFTEKMGSYAPSMRFDYLNKQPLEIAYLYKNPICKAKEAGVDMPQANLLYEQLLKCL